MSVLNTKGRKVERFRESTSRGWKGCACDERVTKGLHTINSGGERSIC